MNGSNDPYADAGFECIGQVRKGAEKSRGRIGPDLEGYFRVVFQKGEEETAALFEQHFGKQPREITITFPFAEPERVWWTGMEAYTGRGIRVMLVDPDTKQILYWFDPHEMKVVVRNGLFVESGEPAVWDGESPAYTYRSKKDQSIKHVFPKLKCRLRVMVPALRRVVYLDVITSSWNDRRNITRQLAGLYQLRGSLKGIPLVLRRRWQEVTTRRPDGQRFREEKSLISIEPRQDWAARLFEKMEQEATPGFTVPVEQRTDDEPQEQEKEAGADAQEPPEGDDWQEDPLLFLDSLAIDDWSLHDAACEHFGYIGREHVIETLNEEMSPGWAKYPLRDLWRTLEENAPGGPPKAETAPESPFFGLQFDDKSFQREAMEHHGFSSEENVELWNRAGRFLDDEVPGWTDLPVGEVWEKMSEDDKPEPAQEEFDIPF